MLRAGPGCAVDGSVHPTGRIPSLQEAGGWFDHALVDQRWTIVTNREVLHGHVVDVVFLADLSAGALAKVDIMECADVRMIQARDGSGFTLETLPSLGVAGNLRGSTLTATVRSRRVSLAL